MMEDYLNAHASAGDGRFEVLNFGLGFYTTAHSLVNYVLNVVDYHPGYLVIHHACPVRRRSSALVAGQL
jgi:hypothetical protein